MLNRKLVQPVSHPTDPYDRWLILLIMCLVGFGLLMVASASIETSDIRLHQPFYYFYRQGLFLAIGIALGSIVIQFEIGMWAKISNLLLIIAILLLAIVLVPGVGHAVNGSSRWIGYGVFRIQVSEIVKFSIVLYMADYLVKRQHLFSQFKEFLKPMALLAIIAGLLIKEPDFGATFVIMVTVLGMMFLAGVKLRHFLVLFLLVLFVLIILALSEPYRIHRLTSFLDPWANPYKSGYQLTQSLIAFGRGSWFGVGLGKSIQKLFYLPEAHTDFLFAVIGEEFGFVGALVVIILFTLLIGRILSIGRTSLRLGHAFSGLVAYGFGLWLGIQFVVSIGVNLGVLPTKGLTLPLVSYGGSSMVVNCIVLAMILRIDYENRMIISGFRDG